MKKSKFTFLGILALSCLQAKVFAHAVIPSHVVLPLHHASGANRFNAFANYPVSGSSRALQQTIKTITGATIRNTVLYAPLNNLSGQFAAVNYTAAGNPGIPNFFYYNNPTFLAFGSNSLNNGTNIIPSGGPLTNITNFTNMISGGLPALKPFPSTVGTRVVSGAQRLLQGYYNNAATAGYDTGISMLQHPTGGLLFGTEYWNNPSFPYNGPGFEAFGNNPYASNAVAGAIVNSPTAGITLSHTLASYIQFGKITRPITNGFLFGTYYYPTSNTGPPYGAGAPGPYIGVGYYGIAVGSNPLNTLIGRTMPFPINTPTYFK